MAPSKNITWYNLKGDESLKQLSSSREGLTPEEAAKRLREYGPNEIQAAKKISPWLIFLEQFKNLLIIILLVAVLLSAILGEWIDALVVLVIIIFAAGLGFIQEYRAEQSLEALKKMAAPTATVLRGGKQKEIPTPELVPGDVFLIATGDRLPADGRLLDAVNLRVEEAPLTGESVSVEKTETAISGQVSVGDRKNMVFAGTTAAYGRGRAVVAETGMNTEFGKIAALLQQVKEELTPLQHNLERLGRWIAVGALGLTAILSLIGILRGNPVLEMLLWGVSLSVAAVPEALPAVVTISLSVGVQRMARRHALVRKLPAVETLGCTNYICSDKTGTLTQDQMTIRRVLSDLRQYGVEGSGYEPAGKFLYNDRTVDAGEIASLKKLLIIGALCNDTELVQEDGRWEVKGDPTEGALVVLAAKAGLSKRELEKETPRVHEIPFSSESKRMTTVHQAPQGRVAMAKGAAEVILDSCDRILLEGKEMPLDAKSRSTALAEAGKMADEALRVLGLAYREAPPGASDAEIQKDMVFTGLVGMIDPPRPEVKVAIRECDAAGINTVMITGDHKATAVAIARELGILKRGLAFSGNEVDSLSQQEFEDIVEKVEVYARVSPEHKLRVVEGLGKKGHVVAMTGDGVNDAPALKRADIGIAMGITGTDVTREAANMVLTDDNFASIVAAVEEGRGIFSNIKKYLIYLLSANLGEILLMAIVILAGPLMGVPAGAVPLIAVQILFVNLATDGLPAIALSVDPPEPDLMKRKPRPRKESIFTPNVMGYLLVAGLWTTAVSLTVFLWAIKTDRPVSEAQSMVFITLILVEFFNAFNCRSLDYSVFQVGFFKNKWLLLSVLVQVPFLLAIIYWPPLQRAFGTHSLSREEWLIAVGLSASIFVGMELFKLIKRGCVKPHERSACD
jgi:P-type Ca2+ transporter type 2C